MPTAWQVEAADYLKTAFELQSTNSGRLSMFSELFTNSHPYWYWQVALNATYAYYFSDYYIYLTTDNSTVLMFSTL